MKISSLISLFFALLLVSNLFGQQSNTHFFDKGKLTNSGQENGVLLPNGNGKRVFLDEFTTRINKELEQSSQVERLEVANAPIADWDSAFVSIGKMEGLRELKFRKCTMDSLPNSVAYLDSIEALKLYSCDFLDMEDAIQKIAKMKNLKRFFLDKSDKDFRIPDNLILLQQLEQLHITGPYDTQNLFDLVAKMPNLTCLTIGYSTSAVHQFDFSKIKHVKELVLLGDMKFDQVFAKIQALDSLHSLVINAANLSSLPEDFGYKFPHLREVRLTSELLTALPNSFAELKELEKLYLDVEKLKIFPPVIFELHGLKSLSLFASTDFELPDTDSLPNQFAQLSKLEYFNCPTVFELEQKNAIYSQFPLLEKIELTLDSTGVIPAAISNIKNLTTVTLRVESTRYLSESLQQLAKNKKLTNLLLSVHSEATFELPATIGDIETLLELSIYVDTQLGLIIPHTIGKITKLKTLNIQATGRVVFPENIGQLQALESLWVSKYYTSSLIYFRIPSSFKNCIALQNVTTKGVLMTEENIKMICELPRLEKLVLESSLIWKLPDEIGNLQQLKILSLETNNLSKLPKSIANLKKLQYLNLKGNSLTVIPPIIGQLTSLYSLELKVKSYHLMSSRRLPASFSGLQNLRYLNLNIPTKFRWKNAFRTIAKLQNLTICHLDMGESHQEKIPTTIGLLLQVRQLYLRGGNSVSFRNSHKNVLPQSIEALSNVEMLTLNWAGLQSLPPEITQLNKLQHLKLKLNNALLDYLDFGGTLNVLSKIPTLKILEIEDGSINETSLEEASFLSLERLYLRANRIDSIGNLFANFPNLKFVDFRDNNISIIPPSIQLASQLQEIVLYRNPLQNIPVSEMYQLKYLSNVRIGTIANLLDLEDRVISQLYDLQRNKEGVSLRLR